MFNNTFLKELYLRRGSTVAWIFGIGLLVVFNISLFHSLRSSFQQAVQGLPVAMRGLVGDASSFATPNGFINQQVFIKMMPIIGLIFTVLLFTGLLAGDEANGTLQVLLSQPVSRTKVLLEKFLSGAMVLLEVCFGVFVFCSLGALLIHESVNHVGLAAVCVALWLLCLAFGSFAYMLGAATGKRGLSGAITAILAFAFYLITSLAAGIKSLKPFSRLSPFKYYTTGDYNVISQGLKLQNVLIFIWLVLVCLLIAGLCFNRRDIYQR